MARRARSVTRAVAALILLILAACQRTAEIPAPPRVTEPARIPVATSQIAVPISAPLADLERLLEAEIPRTLWTIDRQEKECIPAQRLTVCLRHRRPCEGEACRDVPCALGFQRARVTPAMSCRLVGQVTRGRVRLSGTGETLRLAMPVSATVSVRDVGGIVSQTATADAEVRAAVRLDTDANWNPTARLTLDYDWLEEPGFDILGRRIRFTSRADPRLQQLVERLERDLPRKLRKLDIPTQLEGLWREGFTVLELNARNPEVWMRVTPLALSHGGYHVEENRLVLRVALQAATETFVGTRPSAPEPRPLPSRSAFPAATRLRFHLPVVADYSALVPVLSDALERLSREPVDVPLVGPTRVRFGRPILYTTEGGRIALGLPVSARGTRGWARTSGTVWLTGQPINAPNSRRVLIQGLAITGEAENAPGDILLAIVQAPGVRETIETALARDFENDFQELMGKITEALDDQRVGHFRLTARITEVLNGQVQPVGQGLYLPVEARGVARLAYSPAPASGRKSRAENQPSASAQALRAESS